MSEENVAIVRAVWDAIARGDLDEAAALIPEHFVFDNTNSEGPDGQVFSGRESIKAFIAGNQEVWDDLEIFELECIDAGDQVIRVGGMRGRGKGSGVPVEAVGAQVVEFKDGVPVSARLYQSKEEALAAIGLSE
jgi:ketosteroid isomerase-like protein